MNRIDERPAFQLARREPLARVPAADALANLTLRDLEREQALGPDRSLDFLVVDERGRSAEAAVLADAPGLEHAHGLAAAALHGARAWPPLPQTFGHLAQRPHQVDLLDCTGRRVRLVRRLGAAERAHEALPCRVPLRLRTAGGAGMLLDRGDVGHRYFSRYSCSAARLIR